MILGIGNDIVEIARIQSAIDRYQDRFLNRLFTTKEQSYCLRRKTPSVHFAGRFAAKEAIVKAFGTGFIDGIQWLDIEIVPDASGKPCVQLSAKVSEMFNQPMIHLSISHCRDYATATAIWSKDRHSLPI